MENIHKKFFDELLEAEKYWRSADHFVYITLPVVKDPKLMVRALETLNEGVVKNISTILKYEYMYKRINLTKDPKQNLDTFFNKCSKRYGLQEGENALIKELIFLRKKHKDSEVEFAKSDKVIILNGNGSVELTLTKMKEFLKISQKLLNNTNRNFRENYFGS